MKPHGRMCSWPLAVLCRCAHTSSSPDAAAVGARGPLVTRSYWSPQFFPQGPWNRSLGTCHTSATGGHPCSATS